jgi:2-polyprenyl-3-methyl-5-hydroxy-6-metoxy-1,4-benzoquinol methylase
MTSQIRVTAYGSRPCWYRCSTCRSEFLFPQPGDARLAEIYNSAYYEPWEWESQETVGAAKTRTFLRALEQVRPEKGSRLLDVGCAQGEFAAAATRAGIRVVGVDINPDAIARARDRVPEATFHCGELDSGVLGSGWDLVTMFDFIEHVRCPRDVLVQVGSMLAPGGQLLLSTPRAGSVSHRVEGGWWPQYREEHMVLFSLEGIRRALEAAGLRIRSTRATTKFTTGAYLLGQLAAYSSSSGRQLAERSRRILRFRALHQPFPLRFGEMTVVSERASTPRQGTGGYSSA